MMVVSIREIIRMSKRKLADQGVLPPYRIKISPLARDLLIAEINHTEKRNCKAIVEIDGMKIDVENECPPGAGYVIGEDDGR